MIDARELRIGSLVHAHNNISLGQTLNENLGRHEHVISGTDIAAIEQSYSEWYYPIPLTEGWLEKLGLPATGRKSTWSGTNKNIVEYGFGSNFFIEDSHADEGFDIYVRAPLGSYEDSIVIVEKVKHVHQLQNLYFALTGTELEIK